jgi:putative transposase
MRCFSPSLAAGGCPWWRHQPFDDVWRSTGTEIIRTPVRAPNANAVAERWVGTVRRECLDRLLIMGCKQLDRVLRRYVEHYNQRRPHPGLGHMPPVVSVVAEPRSGPIMGRLPRRDLLGGPGFRSS